jgi:copper chaperone NosL
VDEGRGGLAFGLGAVLLVGAAVVIAVALSSRAPDGPISVDWDGVRCARCGMLVSQPAFAAQLHLAGGEVRLYDDPGCLLADLEESDVIPWHAAWLHHHRDERWIPLEEAAFVPVPHSPMGYGLGAVAVGEAASALDRHEARTRVLERSLPRGASR